MAVETKKNLVGGLAGVPASQLKEQKREDNAWKKQLFGYLEGFKKSFFTTKRFKAFLKPF